MVLPTNEEEFWTLIRHGSRIAVYCLEDNPDVFLAATVAPAAACECLQQSLLASAKPLVETSPLFPGPDDVLEKVDDCNHIVRCRWSPRGRLASFAVWPREVALLRSWRKEDDGSLVVSYRSVSVSMKTEKDRKEERLYVPARIRAGAFTIMPLPVETCGSQAECLITFVVDIQDYGGCLRRGSFFSRAFPELASFARSALVDALLLRVLEVRDGMLEHFRRYDGSRKIISSQPTIETPFEARARYDVEPPTTIAESTSFANGEVKASVIGSTSDVPSPDVGMDETMASLATSADMASLDVRELWNIEGTTNQIYYSYPGSSGWRIRGLNYLTDRVKIPAAVPMFDLYASDLINSSKPLQHIAPHLPSIQKCDFPFAFVLNLIYPTPFSRLQSLVTTWTAPVDVETEDLDSLVERWGEDGNNTVRAFFLNFKEWIDGEGPEADHRRNKTFKLIPRITQGPWLVRSSVGTTPVLLGQKLRTNYYKGLTRRGCRYIEADVDITSNAVANNITKMVVNAITSLIVDLAPLVEGRSRDHLPERLIGSVRYQHLNIKTAAVWDEVERKVVEHKDLPH